MAQWRQVGGLPVDKAIEVLLRRGQSPADVAALCGRHEAGHGIVRVRAMCVSAPRASMAGH